MAYSNFFSLQVGLFIVGHRYAAVVGALAALILLLEKKDDPHPHISVGIRRWFLSSLALGCNMFMTFWLFTGHKYALLFFFCLISLRFSFPAYTRRFFVWFLNKYTKCPFNDSVIPRWVGVDPTMYGPGVIGAYIVGALLSYQGKVV